MKIYFNSSVEPAPEVIDGNPPVDQSVLVASLQAQLAIAQSAVAALQAKIAAAQAALA